MTPFLTSTVILGLTTALTFISCDGQNESGVPNGRPDPDTAPDSLQDRDYRQEPAPSPVIIRSAIPPGYYGYEPDTLQVSQYIRRIFQDSRGNLWFGTTDDGVIRYDGTSLSYFTTREGFSGNGVTGILEDKKGNLWFSTNGGVSKYNGNSFVNYTVKDGLSGNYVGSILENKIGNIFVGTSGGVCYYSGASFIPFPIPLGIVDDPLSQFNPKLAWSIIQDKAGNLWFGTDGAGVFKYDGRTFTRFTKKDGLCNNKVVCILEDRKGRLWFSSTWANGEGGVSCYDPSISFVNGSGSFAKYTMKEGLSGNKGVWSIFEDHMGILWFASNGVDKFDPSVALGTGSTSFTNINIKDGLTNIAVQSILEDRKGNLWIGTGAGLFRYDRSVSPGTDSGSVINVTKKGPWP